MTNLKRACETAMNAFHDYTVEGASTFPFSDQMYQFAKALLVMEEALQREAVDAHSGYAPAPPYCMCMAHATLRDVEEILK